MMKNQEFIRIQFVTSAQFSEAAADESSRLLMAELSEVQGVDVKLVNDAPVPEGSKATAAGVCELVVALIGGGALIPTVLNVAHEWLNRPDNRTSIRIKRGDFEVEWSGSTPPSHITQALTELVEQETG